MTLAACLLLSEPQFAPSTDNRAHENPFLKYDCSNPPWLGQGIAPSKGMERVSVTVMLTSPLRVPGSGWANPSTKASSAARLPGWSLGPRPSSEDVGL